MKFKCCGHIHSGTYVKNNIVYGRLFKRNSKIQVIFFKNCFLFVFMDKNQASTNTIHWYFAFYFVEYQMYRRKGEKEIVKMLYWVMFEVLITTSLKVCLHTDPLISYSSGWFKKVPIFDLKLYWA